VLAKALFLHYNKHIATNKGYAMQQATQTPRPSSTGGIIVPTKTGLIHYAGKAYSGKVASQEDKKAAAAADAAGK
jgi:hypothetical protein